MSCTLGKMQRAERLCRYQAAVLQVKHLAPLHVREVEKAVPILTTDEGIGERHIREDVISPISG